MAAKVEFGKLSEFRHGVDTVDDYVDRFELYTVANDITNDDKKRAVFLTSVGATTYALLTNLLRPAKPQSKSLDDLVRLMRDNMEPKAIVIAERYKFYKRNQKEGETIASYIAELCRLARKCEFKDYLNTALRDQLVCGLYYAAVQQKILVEAKLSLDRAIQIAQACESAREETQTLRGQTPQSARQMETAFGETQSTTGGSSQSAKASYKGKACSRCNGTNHSSDKCRYKSFTCHYCKKTGHIIQACRKKERDKSNDGCSKQKSKTWKTTHQIDEDEVSLIFSLSDKRGIDVKLHVPGTEIDMEVDTGATVTVIPKAIFEKRLQHVQLKPNRAKLQAYSGQALKVVGEAMVPLEYKDQQCTEKIIAVDVPDKPAVLGRNLLRQIRLDWGTLFAIEEAPIVWEKQFPQLFEKGMGTVKIMKPILLSSQGLLLGFISQGRYHMHYSRKLRKN